MAGWTLRAINLQDGLSGEAVAGTQMEVTGVYGGGVVVVVVGMCPVKASNENPHSPSNLIKIK